MRILCWALWSASSEASFLISARTSCSVRVRRGCFLVAFVVGSIDTIHRSVRCLKQGHNRGVPKKSPPRPEPGGPGRRRAMLRVDSVRPLTTLGFEGLDAVAGLLHRPGHEPADGVLLPAHLGHELGQGSAVL